MLHRFYHLLLNTVQTLWTTQPTGNTASSFSSYNCMSWSILCVGGNTGVEPPKTIAATCSRFFFFKERYKIPYIVPQIIIIFLENDFTFKVPQIVTHGLVLFLFLSKRLHHFWWGHLFQSWNYFILHETIWGTKGFPVYWKERLKLNIHKLTFFLSEEIPFLK